MVQGWSVIASVTFQGRSSLLPSTSYMLVSSGSGLLVNVPFFASFFHDVPCVICHVLFSICEMLCPMHVKVSLSPIGPLVFPGPLFMNQREQVLARLRPLQAVKLMREKLKGTAVFTTGFTWSPIMPLSLPFFKQTLLAFSRHNILSYSVSLVNITNTKLYFAFFM